MGGNIYILEKCQAEAREGSLGAPFEGVKHGGWNVSLRDGEDCLRAKALPFARVLQPVEAPMRPPFC